jgi:hypothetical protein
MSRLVATVCLAALALGACGGGGYQGLSKADFVTQANAICATGQKTLDSIGASVGSSPTLATLQRVYSGQFVAAVREEVSQLRALKPPKADRATISAMLDDLSSGITQFSAAITSAKSLQAVAALKEPSSLAAADKAATSYGLTACNGAK